MRQAICVMLLAGAFVMGDPVDAGAQDDGLLAVGEMASRRDTSWSSPRTRISERLPWRNGRPRVLFPRSNAWLNSSDESVP